jgi:hypothetical protein
MLTDLYDFQQSWIFPRTLITHQETPVCWQLPKSETKKINHISSKETKCKANEALHKYAGFVKFKMNIRDINSS